MAKTLTITPDVQRADGQGRVTSTIAQAGIPGALVTVGEWLAQETGWDGSLPTSVSIAMVVILAGVASAWKNRSKLRGEV